MSDAGHTRQRLKPWEKTWVNPKFVFKNPRCLKSKIPTGPTCAYDDWIETQAPDDHDDPVPESSPPVSKLDAVSMPKPVVKQPKTSPYRSKESLKEWKQRHRKFIKQERTSDAIFSTRIGFVYSDLPMEPEREAERKLPDFPPGMTRAERRHWEAWTKM